MLPKRDLNFIKRDPETPKTQLVMVVGFLVIAAIFQNEVFAYLALIIGVVSVAVKPLGDRLVWLWYKLAELLSRIMNPLILGLLYYIFITPIALLFRLFGNDPLALKEQRGSLFDHREHTYSKKDLENPW
jgi:hypothetical protein